MNVATLPLTTRAFCGLCEERFFKEIDPVEAEPVKADNRIFIDKEIKAKAVQLREQGKSWKQVQTHVKKLTGHEISIYTLEKWPERKLVKKALAKLEQNNAEA